MLYKSKIKYSLEILLILLLTSLYGCKMDSSQESNQTESINPFQVAKLPLSSETEKYLRFGSQVIKSGDYIAVSAMVGTDVSSHSVMLVYKKESYKSVKLIATLEPDNGYFGNIAMDGEYIVIGNTSEQNNQNFDSYGSVYLFKINVDDSVKKVLKFDADDGEDDWSGFGNIVAIDKNYIAVGTDEESAYLFKINSDLNVSKVAKLTMPIEDIGHTLSYASSIAIDNNRIAISAANSRRDAPQITYLYTINRDDNVTLIHKIESEDRTSFGKSIAMQNNHLLINEPRLKLVHVYKISDDNNVTELAKLDLNQTDPIYDISLSLDNDYIVTFATTADSNRSISLFKINSDESVIKIKELAPNDTFNDIASFGESLCIDGDDIFFGLPSNKQYKGNLYWFSLKAKSDVYLYSEPILHFNLSEGDDLNYSFDANAPQGGVTYTLSGDDQGHFEFKENQLHSITPFNYENPVDSGADNNYTITVSLKDADSHEKSFNIDVSLHDRKYIKNFQVETLGSFSNSIATDGNYTVVGFWNEGKASLYKNSIDGMMEVAQMSGNADLFGSSVAINGKYIAIGAPTANQYKGRVYLYKINTDDTVSQIADIASDTRSELGVSLALYKERLLVGAQDEIITDSSSGEGKIYLYEFNDTNITKISELTATTPIKYDRFGQEVLMYENYILTRAKSHISLDKVDANGSMREISILPNYQKIAIDKNRIVAILDNNLSIFSIDVNDTLKTIATLELNATQNGISSLSIKNDNFALCLNGKANIFHIETNNTIIKEDILNQYNEWSCSNVVMGVKDDIFVSSGLTLYRYLKDKD